MDIPRELVEQFARGNGVIFIGSGLSQGAGLPGWGELQQSFADELADLCDSPLENVDRSLPSVARIYQATMGGPKHGRQALVARLREWLEQDGHAPAPLHLALVDLPLKRIVD